jgi:hypothetical protein
MTPVLVTFSEVSIIIRRLIREASNRYGWESRHPTTEIFFYERAVSIKLVNGELVGRSEWKWPDPVFCTRRYESMSTDSSSSGLPSFSTFLSRSAATANSAGGR